MKTIQIRGVGLLLLCALFFNLVIPAPLSAQLVDDEAVTEEECGFIIEESGFRDGFLDCDNPFDAVGNSPYSVFLEGTLLSPDTPRMFNLPATLTFLIQQASERDPFGVNLYRRENNSNDYRAVPLNDIVELQQYEVDLAVGGEFVLVFNREPAGEAVYEWLPSFFNTAHAQVSEPDDPNPPIYTLPFIITAESLPQCGSFFFGNGSVQPVTDCDNPFGLENPNESLQVTFAENTIEDTGSYALLDVADRFTITNLDNQATDASVVLWRHQGEDYIQELGYNPFRDDPGYRFTATGTYSLVVDEFAEATSSFNWLNFIQELISTTAHAALGDRTIIEFTVIDTVAPPPEPTGASSVLFLPGIQASRLYQDGFLGSEDQIWEPTNLFSQDVRNLEMTAQGESINEVYTRDIMDAVPGIGDVYAVFSDFMDTLVEEKVIADWTPFAYDWRFDVFDIVENGTQYENSIENPVEEILSLADDSNSGQVTIVAHSNGGLLAKAIMDELVALGEANKVDRIILIGSPQLGTPKAIGTILHGYDQQAFYRGFVPVIQSEVAREVINNLPGAYSLLPAAAYFEQSPVPLVRFDESEVVADLRSAYGSEITDFDTYLSFLRGDGESLNRSLEEPVSFPATANEELLNQAILNHADRLDNWTAPADVEVIEVIGVGLPTMKSVLYRGVTETGSCQPDNLSDGCSGDVIIKPYAELTLFGDETVMQISAEGYIGDKQQYYLNLEDLNLFNRDNDLPANNHGNITEVQSVLSVIQTILENEDVTSINFVSTTEPNLTERYNIEIIDSPVQIFTEDEAGNQTGVIGEGENRSIKVEIPGSQYFEFGDTKYLILPANTDRTTTLIGEGVGGYTLTVAELDADSQEIVHEISNATVTPTMSASYQVENGVFSSVTTDLNGDGFIDLETSIDGEVIEPMPATYDQLRESIKDLDLRRADERRILLLLRLAERFEKKAEARPFLKRLEDRLLTKVDRQLVRQVRRGRITQAELESLQSIIELLKKN